jgi:acetyltransferase-like isoleucine patch superfamily enzyme
VSNKDLVERLKGELKYGKAWGFNLLHRRKAQGFIPRDLGVLKRAQESGRVNIGRGTYGVPGLHMTNYDDTKLYVGNYSSIGSLCYLGGGHPPDRVTTYPLAVNLGLDNAGDDGFPAPSKDTVIGSDVYSTHQTVILSGCTIGDGAIVGIGAIVTKDVPAYAIVGGNPARLIRYRFSADQVAALLEIRWWDWPEDEIKLAAPHLTSRDVNAFIDYAEKRNPGWVDPMAGVVNPEAPSFEKAPSSRDPHITKRLPEDAAAAVAANLEKTG